jgi:REP element-mobilizing transposase RayT
MRRREIIAVGEYYHVFNRGVEKRNIFQSQSDYKRFLESLVYFNTRSPIEMKSDEKILPEQKDRLVDIVAYCLNKNHFHFLLKENKENGIATFMKKVCTGYALYFNNKNERSGVLFQGRFKSVHMSSNDLLLYVSAYVNCNSQIHNIEEAEKYRWCSFSEYLGIDDEKCQKSSVLDQFKDMGEYKTFCLEKVVGMQDKKRYEKFFVEN